MTASPARIAALEVVTRVRERSAFAHETLDAVLTGRDLAGRDAALATRLAYGAVSTRGTLDEAIDRFSDPGTKLEPRVRDALALGAYELMFAGTPQHAAVSETVELVRSIRRPASGLANALMRRIAAGTSDFPWGDPLTDVEALARKFGHPTWLADMWQAELGNEVAASIMAADNEPAPMYLALLSDPESTGPLVETLEAEGAGPAPCPLSGCLHAENPAAARAAHAVATREVLVMDAAAQFAVHAVRPRSGMRVVEVGAGRGSKSLLLAALARRTGDRAQIVAVDLHSYKLESLARDAAVLGYSEIETKVADATTPDADLGVPDGTADAVLVDAPCSGLGTLRRHPDRRWRAQPSEIEALAALGARLLARASRLVKPGGFMVYSTCTIARRENEMVVEEFLASGAGEGFSADSLVADVPDEWAGFVGATGFFQSLPEPAGPDGHFVARLKRT